MAEQQISYGPQGQVLGVKGALAGKSFENKRHYRSQIGLGDAGAYSKYRAGREDTEEEAEAYLKSRGRAYKVKPAEPGTLGSMLGR